MLWFAKNPEGKTYIWRELYGIGKDDHGKPLPNVGSKETPDIVAKRIKEREKHDDRLGIEIGPSFTGPDLFAKGGGQYGVQNTHAHVFKQHGVVWRPWWAGPGSRAAGALMVKAAFQNDELFVFDTCEHFLRTVPSLEPDPDNPDDVDTDGEDHAFDCLKGGLLRSNRSPSAPEESLSGDPEASTVHILADGRHRVG